MTQAHPRRPRIADVAHAAGVSKTSVSFAFNSPDQLGAETTERILGIAAEMGYRPHPVARMLSAGRTMTIGVLTPQSLSQVFANPFFAYFSEGVAAVTEEHGFGLLLISPFRGSLTRALDRATVDGVVAVGLEETHPEVEALRRAGLPMVLVDAPGWPEHSSVQVDDEAGASLAAAHLLGLGHRDVLIIGVEGPASAAATVGVLGGSDGQHSVTVRRLRGYLSVLEPAGVDVGPSTTVVAPATFEGGEAAFLRAWEDGLRPTGVLAMSDAMAIGVLQASRHLRLRVPRDLSVVGFDDLPIARFSDPPLTTVHQPVRQKGEEAARLLLEELGANGDSAAEHRMLKTRLVVRRSTAVPLAATRKEVGQPQ